MNNESNDSSSSNKPSDKFVGDQLTENASDPLQRRLLRVVYAQSFVTYALIVVLLIFSIISVFGLDTLQSHRPIFGLLVLLFSCLLGGWLVSLLNLPSLLGMLVAGLLLGNFTNFTYGISPDISSLLRRTALLVILARAGLSLDARALRRLSLTVFRLAFVPCLVEAFVVATVAFYLLHFSWLWAMMLGFILAAVSPAVVVPCLLSVQQSGLGVSKGIPTLVIAAASIDDILAISCFGIAFGLVFSEGSLWLRLLWIPLELVVGVCIGICAGCVLRFIPSKSNTNFGIYRAVLLALFAITALFGCHRISVPGSGPIAILIMSFVAEQYWVSPNWNHADNTVVNIFGKAWYIFQPFLFGLIGIDVRFSSIDFNLISLALLTIFIGLLCRCLVTYLVVYGANLNHRERLFIAISWLPKATVQAALGPVALDTARRLNRTGMIAPSNQIMMVAVLVILVTAPLGAAAITLLAPTLLSRQVSNSEMT